MADITKIQVNGSTYNIPQYTHPSTHPASMITELATVATSGSYNDLSNKPTIPAAITVDTAISASSTNPVQNKVVYSQLQGKANSSHTHTKSQITDFPTLATVATSGSYNDLSNKPSIPDVSGKVNKNGDTMTGTLTLKGVKLTSNTDYGSTLPSSGMTGQLFFKTLTNGLGELTYTVVSTW